MNIRTVSSLLTVLADPTRLRLLAVLQSGTLAVTEMASTLSLSQPRVSHHLAVLLRAGLLRVRRDGTRAYYSLESNSESAEFAAFALSMLTEDTVVRSDVTRAAQQILHRQEKRRAFFAGFADSLPEKLGQWFDLETYKSALLSRVPSGLMTADLGCGPGWLLPDLSKRCATLVGVDQVPEVLALARQTAIQNDLTNCEFRLGELEHLPLADAEVELVILGLVLQHVVDPPSVLAEAARALCSGGRLIIVEPVRHEVKAARDDLGEVWMGFDGHEIREWLSAVGFIPNKVEQLPTHGKKLNLFAVTAEKCCNNGGE